VMDVVDVREIVWRDVVKEPAIVARGVVNVVVIVVIAVVVVTVVVATAVDVIAVVVIVNLVFYMHPSSSLPSHTVAYEEENNVHRRFLHHSHRVYPISVTRSFYQVFLPFFIGSFSIHCSTAFLSDIWIWLH